MTRRSFRTQVHVTALIASHLERSWSRSSWSARAERWGRSGGRCLVRCSWPSSPAGGSVRRTAPCWRYPESSWWGFLREEREMGNYWRFHFSVTWLFIWIKVEMGINMTHLPDLDYFSVCLITTICPECNFILCSPSVCAWVENNIVSVAEQQLCWQRSKTPKHQTLVKSLYFLFLWITNGVFPATHTWIKTITNPVNSGCRGNEPIT